MIGKSGLGVLVTCLLLVGCGMADDPDERPTIRIASDATFAPFHFIDETGEPTGFDIELATAIADKAGFDVSIAVLPYDELFTKLLEGEHDIVAATTGITPERQEIYLFSAPYYDTCQAILVRAGDGEPTNLTELAGRRVGAPGAGTSVRALNNLPDAIHVRLDSGKASIEDDGTVPTLDDKTIDALIVDEFDAVEAARTSDGRLRVLSEPAALEQYALVLRPGDVELKRALDAALSSLSSDGTLARLEQKYGLNRDADWPVRLSPD